MMNIPDLVDQILEGKEIREVLKQNEDTFSDSDFLTQVRGIPSSIAANVKKKVEELLLTQGIKTEKISTMRSVVPTWRFYLSPQHEYSEKHVLSVLETARWEIPEAVTKITVGFNFESPTSLMVGFVPKI